MNATMPAAVTASSSSRQLVVLSLITLYIVWGSTYLVIHFASAAFAPFFMSGSRFATAGLVMVVVLLAGGHSWPTRREWLAAIPIGIMLCTLGNGLVCYAELTIASGAVALIVGTVPLMTAAIGPIFGARTSTFEWLALGLGFIGVAVLAAGGEMRSNPGGTILLLFAPLAWSFGSHLMRILPIAKGLMGVGTQMLMGGLGGLIVSAVLGEPWLTSIPPAKPLLSWLYLVVMGSLASYSAYVYLLRNTKTSIATSYAFVNPGVAIVLGALLGGERIGPETLVALSFIVGAILMLFATRSRKTLAAR